MLWIVAARRKKFSIKNYRYLSFRLAGYLKLQQNKDVVVLVEQDQAIVIDYTQLHFFQKWINTVIQRS
jgi:hypothetical protein